MRRARIVALLCAAAVAATVVSACNAITGLSDDFRLGDASLDATGATDAAGPGDGDPTADGGPSDATAADATADRDAATDAGPFSCSRVDASFCDDFEGTDGLDHTLTSASETVGVVADGGKDNSKGLVAHVALTAAMQNVSAWHDAVITQIPTTFTHYSVDFDFEQLVTNGSGETGLYYAFAEIGWPALTSAGSDENAIAYATGRYSAAQPPADGGSSVAAPDGQWRHAHVEVDKVGAGWTLTITVDASPVYTSGVVTSAPSSGTTELRFGIFYTYPIGGGATIDVHFDNIYAAWSP